MDKNNPPFKPGDKVRFNNLYEKNFITEDCRSFSAIRTVLSCKLVIEKGYYCESSYLVTLSPSDPCDKCGMRKYTREESWSSDYLERV